MEVDTTCRPWYSFGNGERRQAYSKATFDVVGDNKEGTFDVHAMKAPGVPMLASIMALRSLGAIIDFGRDTAIFENINKDAAVLLERAKSQHLLLPLAGDILQNRTTSPEHLAGFLNAGRLASKSMKSE